MRFFKRLSNGNGHQNLPSPSRPKIKLDWFTWVPLFFVFLANIFLILPLWGESFSQVAFTAPVLPFLSGGKEELVKFIILGTYVLGAVFLYFYVWEVSNRRLTSLLASLIYTLSTARLSQALIFKDPAHIVALNLLPLALFFFVKFLRRLTLNLGIIASVAVALIGLISPFGLFTLVIFILLLTYSEMLLGQARLKILSALSALLAAAGLLSFWYHPQLLMTIFQAEHGEALLAVIWKLVPFSFFLVPVLGAFSFLIFDRKPALQPLFLALSQFFTFFLLVFVGTNISNAYVPIPSRFFPELSLSLACLLAVILVAIFEILRSDSTKTKLKLPSWVWSSLAPGFLTFVLTFLVFWLIFNRPHFLPETASSTGVLGIEVNQNAGGISQIFGGAMTLLTVLILGLVKFKPKIS